MDKQKIYKAETQMKELEMQNDIIRDHQRKVKNEANVSQINHL